MMSEVLLYLIMITCILIRVSSKEVKWTVRDTSPKLGQDLTLFCKVDNCTVDETKRWHGGPDDKVLMLYTGISTDKAKYSTSIEKNGFILTILNITVKDLNVSYECSCGLDNDKHILYIEDVDTVDNLNKTINGTIGTNDVGGIPWYVIILIIIAVILIVLIIAIVIKRHWLWRKLKEKIYGPQRRNSAPVHIPTDEDPQRSDADDGQNVTTRLLENTELHSNPRQCSDADDGQNVTTRLLENTELDSNPRQCSDEVDSQNVADPLSQTTNVDSNLGQSSDAESFEPSTSLETNSNKPDSSFQYSNNHKDVPASTCLGKKHMEYANIKLREKSFKTWPLKKPTIEQLAKAGFFHSGYQNNAYCFSCRNKITWEEDWNPLDEVFQITST